MDKVEKAIQLALEDADRFKRDEAIEGEQYSLLVLADEVRRLRSPGGKEPIRDWTEDFSHENGQYQNTCCYCRETFIGHKRRVVCKLCYKPAPAAPEPSNLPGIPVKSDPKSQVKCPEISCDKPGPGVFEVMKHEEILTNPNSFQISISAPESEKAIENTLHGCSGIIKLFAHFYQEKTGQWPDGVDDIR